MNDAFFRPPKTTSKLRRVSSQAWNIFVMIFRISQSDALLATDRQVDRNMFDLDES